MDVTETVVQELQERNFSHFRQTKGKIRKKVKALCHLAIDDLIDEVSDVVHDDPEVRRAMLKKALSSQPLQNH